MLFALKFVKNLKFRVLKYQIKLLGKLRLVCLLIYTILKLKILKPPFLLCSMIWKIVFSVFS
jgi:hypothetical protein